MAQPAVWWCALGFAIAIFAVLNARFQHCSLACAVADTGDIHDLLRTPKVLGAHHAEMLLHMDGATTSAAAALMRQLASATIELINISPEMLASYTQRESKRGSHVETGFKRGWSHVMANLQESLPAAAQASEVLQTLLGMPFCVNAYAHPLHDREEPICAHSDPQELVILQLQGCRRWTVWEGGQWDGGLEYPFPTQVFLGRCDPKAEAAALDMLNERHYELRAGQVLFLPWRRNLVHRTGPCASDNARGGEERSVHWTLTGLAPHVSAVNHLFNAFHTRGGPSTQTADALEKGVQDATQLGTRLRQLLPYNATVRRDAQALQQVVDHVVELWRAVETRFVDKERHSDAGALLGLRQQLSKQLREGSQQVIRSDGSIRTLSTDLKLYPLCGDCV